MNRKLEDYLHEKYPKIFVDLYGDPTKTCLAYGIECDDGWFTLIDKLCHSIQEYIDRSNGWIEKGHDVNSKIIPQLFCLQCKEKFGGLRFYYEGGDDKIDGMVMLSEELSYSICENCGRFNYTVIPYGKSWVKTLCPDCRTNRSKVRKDGENINFHLSKVKNDKLFKIFEKIER